MEYRTTDIRTGLFITFTLVAATVLIFLMGGVRGAFRDAREIQVLFDNVRLLEREAPVTLGGFRVGEVASISRIEVTEPGGKKGYKVVVKMSVDRDLDLRSDARAMVKTDGFLGGKFVALTPGVNPMPLVEGKAIPGSAEINVADLMAMVETPIQRLDGILKALEGFSTNQRNLDNVEGILSETHEILNGIREKTLPRAEGILAVVQDTLRNANAKMDHIGDKVEATLDTGTRTVQELGDTVRKRVGKLDGVLEEAMAVLGEVRTGVNRVAGSADRILTDNNRNLYLTLRNLRDATAELDRLMRKLRADPSVVIWGDDEKVEPAALPRDPKDIRTNGKASRYGKEPGK